MEGENLLKTMRPWFERRAMLFKLMGAGFLGLLLLIPLGMVRSTLFERQARYQEAVRSITDTWGSSQQILGPVLIVPFTQQVVKEVWVERNGQRALEKRASAQKAEAFFLPEHLEVISRLEPATRERGIFVAHVYGATVQMTGRFAAPDFSSLGLEGIEPEWNRARVALAASDLRGVRDAAVFAWNGDEIAMEPGVELADFGNGVHAALPAEIGADGATFSIQLTLNGAEQFFLVPAGRTMTARIESTWPDPSFGGAYLPVARTVGEEGFEAEWQISYYGRGVPQQWTSLDGDSRARAAAFQAAAFGVTLMEPVNAYRTVERSIKFGILFIVLVFATFFVFEMTCGVRLNALNYLLVGAALCLFFLSLLALSEFLSFGHAYSGAAAASILLIGLYSRTILGRRGRAWLVSGLLGVVYAYLYLVLQLEDFSLLAGTGALFVILATVMYVTRNLNLAASPGEATAAPS